MFWSSWDQNFENLSSYPTEKRLSEQKMFVLKLIFSNFQLNSAPADIPDMYSKPGTACNDYTGYCDVFQKCREVNWKDSYSVVRGWSTVGVEYWSRGLLEGCRVALGVGSRVGVRMSWEHAALPPSPPPPPPCVRKWIYGAPLNLEEHSFFSQLGIFASIQIFKISLLNQWLILS